MESPRRTGPSGGSPRSAVARLGLMLLLSLCAKQGIATTGSGTLTAVSEPGFNTMAITITPSGLSSSTKNTTVTGTVDARVAADPAAGATTALTLSGTTGDLSMSDMSFSWVFGIVKLEIRDMAGYAYTPLPPVPVTPNSTGGTFEGRLQELIINRGNVSGITSLDFADSPILGVGTGTGTVTMVAGTASATHRIFEATVVVPVDFTDIVGSIDATVRVRGTLKATGTIALPLNDFIAWAEGYGLADASFTAPVEPGAAPLGLAWASGLEPATPLSAIIPSIQATPPSITAVITLPPTGTRAPLWIEVSTDLTDGSWNPVAASDVSAGFNPLPIGTGGPVTVLLGTGPRQFIRLRVDSP